jgi:TrmH family RNA methyltransferase
MRPSGRGQRHSTLVRHRTITSRDNPSLKSLRALAADTREPRRQGRALLDGPHLVGCYLAQIGLPELLVLSESGARNAEIERLLALLQAVERITVPEPLFRELSGVAAPVGILAVVPIPKAPLGRPTLPSVLLDGIQDAGNVGTILRTAAAAGYREVVLGAGCAGAWTPRVLRAAQGAHFGLRIREQADLNAVVQDFGAATVAAVASGGTPLYDLDLSGEQAWIFGNEGAGIASSLVAGAGRRATIPLASGSESLNVAAAAAICLFESLRQRSIKRGPGCSAA